MLAVLLYFALLLASGYSKPANRENSAVIYREGTYRSSAKGYGGDLTVEVDFSGNAILVVRVTEHNETEWIDGQAIAFLPDNIAMKQDWDVDTVTGTTIASEVITATVRHCIRQASIKKWKR
jgi:fumarate reductase flavoprotein subunit